MKIPDLYDIQKKFITDCKKVIDNSSVGIFSSPTGTGKTLSLLLSVLEYITELEEDDVLLENLVENFSRTKIYFCSRTHSQLKQCLHEFKNLEVKTNSVILGSQKIYCINREIDNKEDINKVNQKCKDLIKQDNCKYYKQDMFVSGIYDIEQLVKEGRKHKACPYFFSKKYFKKCELVFLPYNLLFNEENRKNININLINSIVIVDEAHNIIDTVNNFNTITIHYEIMEKYFVAFNKYKKLLNLNSKSIKIVVNMLDILQKLVKYKNSISKIMEVNAFLYDSNLLKYNMLDIEENLKQYNICAKIEAYGKNLQNKIFDIIKFLSLLVNSDKNCKIEVADKYLKIFPIDAKLYFEPFFDCQSIVFAGGTMEPIQPLQDIFNAKNVEYFSYDSIIKNFRGFIICEFDHKRFELTEKTRDVEKIQMEIILIIKKIACTVKKGGVVVFLPSKYYLEFLRKLLKDSENYFFENFDIFEDYAKATKTNKCVLFAVMGGKLSEGVNFNDDLCRVLVIFGVPFPNISVEIAEKIKYFGENFYLQMAMKKVNQTIGRALRHVNDYASIFLIDARYNKYKKDLSLWFRQKVKDINFETALNETGKFLDEHY